MHLVAPWRAISAPLKSSASVKLKRRRNETKSSQLKSEYMYLSSLSLSRSLCCTCSINIIARINLYLQRETLRPFLSLPLLDMRSYLSLALVLASQATAPLPDSECVSELSERLQCSGCVSWSRYCGFMHNSALFYYMPFSLEYTHSPAIYRKAWQMRCVSPCVYKNNNCLGREINEHDANLTLMPKNCSRAFHGLIMIAGVLFCCRL